MPVGAVAPPKPVYDSPATTPFEVERGWPPTESNPPPTNQPPEPSAAVAETKPSTPTRRRRRRALRSRTHVFDGTSGAARATSAARTPPTSVAFGPPHALA